MSENVAYYAIIPANVRYDPDLPPNAKLLYGEITALCNEKGFCWASNRYFAELYGVSIRSVQNWITALFEKGYIQVTNCEKNDSETGEIRLLSIVGSHEKIFIPPRKNFHTLHEKNFIPPHENFFTHNNTSINNTSLKGDAKFQKNFANFSPKEIMNLFNEICISLEPAKYLTSSRREAIEAMKAKYSAEDIEECFRCAEASAFLKGQNERSWKATFDWLIQENNMARVLEGNFSDHNLNHAQSPIGFDLDEFFEAATLRAAEDG